MTEQKRDRSAVVMSIGTELTRGELVNSNASWLGEQLTALGFSVVEHISIDDDAARISAAFLRVTSNADVVVSTGGLGPTTDDRTSAAVADSIDVELVRDPASFELIKRKYESRGRTFLTSNQKQADFPEGATVLPNEVGTAPGFMVDREGHLAFFLPGVPREMKAMFSAAVIPQIASLGHRDTHQVHLRSFGLPESIVGERLRDLESENVELGYRAHFPEIEIKVLARASSESLAERCAQDVAERVRERLGEVVYGGRDDTFAGVVGKTLRDKGVSLAVAESCTGGMVGAMLTSVPGSSDYLLFDAVTYANSAKSEVLGVGADVLRGYGAVSSETAEQMADGARRVAGADLAISITGIAGPGGGTEDKPVGTVWFGIARRDEPTLTVSYRFHGDRERVRVRAAYEALALMRRAALGRPIVDVANATG